ncbi:MAG: sigma factor-like helix-turn-helix DNA-binding protein [Patescibacteria group bacterium]|jgi:transcription antitermination factor NusG
MDMGVSILDRIIASKEDQEKQEFEPGDVVRVLLAKLNDKEADVLQRRYGLNGVPKETLEAIGVSYTVTRERIRQIENLAVSKIKLHPSLQVVLKPIEHVILTTLEEHGGIMQESHLLSEVLLEKSTVELEAALVFILTELLSARVMSVGPDKTFMKSWRIKTADIKFITESLDLLVRTIGTANIPLNVAGIMNLIPPDARLTEKTIIALLEVSDAIDHNPFDEYGLRAWGSVVPKRMNDKIYLILKKVSKPMHFVDIAQQITEVFKKEAHPPTVHNELILNSQYVLVGRGIYALKEWGYEKGAVADIVKKILTERGPLTRDQLVTAVLEQRIVKKNTIHLALTNRRLFSKLPDGRYTVVYAPAA